MSIENNNKQLETVALADKINVKEQTTISEATISEATISEPINEIPVKKKRTQKQLDATARLLENNRIKRELLKKHNESLLVTKKNIVDDSTNNEVKTIIEKPKRVYKKRQPEISHPIINDDKPPIKLPPPLENDSDYTDSSSDEFVPQPKQQTNPKPKRVARRFRVH